MPDEKRIELRKEVKEIMDDLIGERPKEFWEVFADEIKRRDFLQAEEIVDPSEFDDEEGEKFGNEVITFGAHSGKKYRQVELSYLEYITDRSMKLSKYVRWRQRRGME